MINEKSSTNWNKRQNVMTWERRMSFIESNKNKCIGISSYNNNNNNNAKKVHSLKKMKSFFRWASSI